MILGKFHLSFKYANPLLSYKKREESPDKFVSINFPYGIMDYDGLSTLIVYHNYMALKKKNYEEKTWLTQLKESHESLGMSMEKN